MRGKWFLLAIVAAVSITAIASSNYYKAKTTRIDTPQANNAPAVNGLKALLFVPDAHWNKAGELNIYVAVQNESKSQITIDRRLDMGSSIRLTIETKDGTVNYTPFGVTIASPEQSDLIRLAPGEFLGRHFVISRENAFGAKTQKAIENIPTGVAKIKVEYTTLSNVWDWRSRQHSWWNGQVASNEVSVEIK